MLAPLFFVSHTVNYDCRYRPGWSNCGSESPMKRWNVINRIIYLAIALGGAFALVCVFWPQYKKYEHFQHQESDLKEKITREEKTIKDLMRQQERFVNDPTFVERIAHEAGMVKSNETLFTFVDSQPNAVSSARDIDKQ